MTPHRRRVASALRLCLKLAIEGEVWWACNVKSAVDIKCSQVFALLVLGVAGCDEIKPRSESKQAICGLPPIVSLGAHPATVTGVKVEITPSREAVPESPSACPREIVAEKITIRPEDKSYGAPTIVLSAIGDLKGAIAKNNMDTKALGIEARKHQEAFGMTFGVVDIDGGPATQYRAAFDTGKARSPLGYEVALGCGRVVSQSDFRCKVSYEWRADLLLSYTYFAPELESGKFPDPVLVDREVRRVVAAVLK